MSGDTEHASVEIPEAESPENHSWQARHAEILHHIEEAGHPRALNQSQLADRYGCARQSVTNDFDVLAECVEENLGGRQALVAQNVFQRCIDELLEEGEWRVPEKREVPVVALLLPEGPEALAELKEDIAVAVGWISLSPFLTFRRRASIPSWGSVTRHRF